MAIKKSILLIFLLSTFLISNGQYLSRSELELLDTCYYCADWRKEERRDKDSVLVIRYFDESGQDRRVQELDRFGVCINLYHKDATGNMGGLSYSLYPDYSTSSYSLDGEGYGLFMKFSIDHKLTDIYYFNSYGHWHSQIMFDRDQRIKRKAQLSDTDPMVWHYWVYDKRGRVREEGFTYNQSKFGEWKYYNPKGRLVKTKDFGPRPVGK